MVEELRLCFAVILPFTVYYTLDLEWKKNKEIEENDKCNIEDGYREDWF